MQWQGIVGEPGMFKQVKHIGLGKMKGTNKGMGVQEMSSVQKGMGRRGYCRLPGDRPGR